LLRQTNQDFIWLVIDDGSTDNTESLVQSWINENIIAIQYHYQENQGMHGGHNAAYQLAETELNVCIDSDDFMPDTAVADIVEFWGNVSNKNDLAGIIGLDAFKDGKIIGEKFPKHLKESNLEDIHNKYKINGDKKLVLRTDVIKKYKPYPIFKEERFVPLGILYLHIDKDYKLAVLNKVLCIVEYMPDGSSMNIVKQYYRHPRGFQYERMEYMKYSNYTKVKFRNAIHYINSSLLLKDWRLFKKTPELLLTVLAIPFGVLLYFYTLYFNKIKK